MREEWDVAVVGGGPAGLAAAITAATAGARTVVLERSRYPRYKTCGGGLIGASLATVAPWITVPSRDHIHAVTATHDGDREFSREDTTRPLLEMVLRDEFDDALRKAAAEAGASIREDSMVRAIDHDGGQAVARLAGGEQVRARVLVGTDGSGGVSARHAGVEFEQVDLGLEVEVPVPEPVRHRWRGRLQLDWGPIPGSYGWVFPKSDRLTVGVIAARGQGDGTRAYLRRFVDRLGLAGYPPVHDSGHLTRCRTLDSPLRKGRVLVAGDAAGLLEPWTREGISFALRSGTFAGTAAAAAAGAADEAEFDRALDGYLRDVDRVLIPEMRAGRRLLSAFMRHPGLFHRTLATPPGWRAFTKLCRSEVSFAGAVGRPGVRTALAALGRGGRDPVLLGAAGRSSR
ncbi:geranylgeranyl reductase family protein [Rugosimonospora africana]|uniref:Hyaluronate lyase n=1 Tax=Rugosimonospora africana TaxID=556532 RepID=A0A8J3QWB8_9ACTN|nr:geranylgeranyl reductase family protein [Rugosimonospora africana]GIH17282.1 hyaluronate lyase [Rugosimonospora africana]